MNSARFAWLGDMKWSSEKFVTNLMPLPIGVRNVALEANSSITR